MYVEEFPGCCAADVICGLSGNGKKTPKQLVIDFLKSDLMGGYYDYYEKKQLPREINVAAFVLFSEVTQIKRRNRWTTKGTATVPTGYGKKLAKYIEDNDLGEIVATPSRINVGKHEDHKDTLYVWATNQKNLKKFAIDNKII